MGTPLSLRSTGSDGGLTMRHPQTLVAFGLLLLSACGGDGTAEDPSERSPLDLEDPARVLADLEADPLESRGVEISFEVHTTGAFTAELTGHLPLMENEDVQVGEGDLRMGVLHNLARLVGGAPPDATGGEVRERHWHAPL